MWCSRSRRRFARARVAALIAAGVAVTSAGIPSAFADNTAPGGGQPMLIPKPPIGPTGSKPNEGSYVLRKTADGGYVADDLRFQAAIAPDGHVTFKDAHGTLYPQLFGISLDRPRAPQGDNRPSLMTFIQRKLRGDPNRLYPLRPPDGFAVADPSGIWDPAARLPPLGRYPVSAPFISVAGTFDLTDELMSATGQGWYRYEKAKFLSATFNFRLKMAAERHSKLLRESLAELPSRLDALWAEATYLAREKRGIICLLWSEVDVADPESRAAADAVLAWIGRRLPAGGSPDAYSEAELSACSQSGGRPFNPYSK